jgi:proteasome lid subunit RPN8/RPN11
VNRVEIKYTIRATAVQQIVRRARAAARVGRQTCGLIIGDEKTLTLCELANKTRRTGGFSCYVPEVRNVIAAAERRGRTVVGTFHSHPVDYRDPDPRISFMRLTTL